MRPSMALLAVLPACGFSTRTSPGGMPGDAAIDVAEIDAAIPPDAAPVCYGTIAPVCFPTAPTGAITFPAAMTTVIDTHSSAMCSPAATKADLYCVIAGESIALPATATLRASGDKPLILISTTGTFELAGIIDVGSKAGSNVGAGGNGDCTAGADPTGATGGAGGSFGGVGGAGKGVDGSASSPGPKQGSFPTTLRGGCRGGNGAGEGAGDGGNSGGAVAIVAPRITITGQINASGSGGHGGGPKKSGGGGGGSGGMIVLEAPMIIMVPGPAQLFANGGGGGQGGGMVTDHAADGLESTGPFTPGTGGKTGQLPGGGGANGSSGATTLDGDTATNGAGGPGGGGGGGGASGFIRAPGATSTNIAPASDPP